MKKIAIIARNMSGKTGASTIVLEQAQSLADHGWRVTLITNRAPRSLVHPRIRKLIVPRIGLGKDFKRHFFSAAAALFVRMVQPDLVYGHGDSLLQDVLALHNCTHLAHEAQFGSPLPVSSDVGRFHARQLGGGEFTHLLANSEMMKRDLMTRFGIPADKISVLYPGFDPEKFNNRDKVNSGDYVRKLWNLPPDSILIGFLTSGDFQNRNLETLFRALAKLRINESPDLFCMVVGSDKHIARYKCLADELGIENRIIWAGFQNDSALYFKAFDIYVHPVHFEAFGMTILEAMACGTPVITTSTAGASELIGANARRYVLEPPFRAETLAASIGELLAADEQRKELAQLSQETVQAHSWDDNYKQLGEILERVYKSKRKR